MLADPRDQRWPGFAADWDGLPHDTWMADGGTYRRRRYGAFHVERGQCERLPHRPHYQERDHNPLNGGLERWFAPMLDASAQSPLFRDLLLGTAALVAGSETAWLVETHQFRIEASAGRPGLPTPEGMHRDGRDHVLILLVDGQNFTGGVTQVEDGAGAPLLEHRLASPGEALLLDDRAVRHGTSPIEAVDSRLPAWRDTLVLTFAALSAQ
jgi:hypothetical protein